MRIMMELAEIAVGLQNDRNKSLVHHIKPYDAKFVESDWKEFSKEHEKQLSINGKFFVRPFLKEKDGRLIMKINWLLFIEYLDQKAKEYIKELKRDGASILNVYGDIWRNLFCILGEVTTSHPKYARAQYSIDRDRFLRLLRRIGDYFYVKELLGSLAKLVLTLREILIKQQKIEKNAIEPFINELYMDVYHIYASVFQAVNITSAYLYLRNIIEKLTKLLIYVNLAKIASELVDNKLKTEDLLKILFIYEYEALKAGLSGRIFSLKKFENKFLKTIRKLCKNARNEQFRLKDILDHLISQKVQPLGWGRKNVMFDFLKRYNLTNSQILNIYSACSEIIHNQPPLPFLSLLEFKYFKYFLREFLYSLHELLEKVLNTKIDV